MCGICAIYNSPNAVNEIVDALYALQHRGQNGAGIVTSGEGGFDLRKGCGCVRDVEREQEFHAMKGNSGIGHVRYPTIGRHDKKALYANAQPEVFCRQGSPKIAMAHNGQVTNIAEMQNYLSEHGISFPHNLQLDGKVESVENECDVKYILGALAIGLLDNDSLDSSRIFEAAGNVMKKVKGAYSVVAILKNSKEEKLLAFTDPCRIRPLVVGRNGNSYIAASETCAFGYNSLGFKKEFDVGPGEAVIIGQDGLERQVLYKQGFRPCMFEFVYFASPESEIDSVPVSEVRYSLGRKLGENEPCEFDIVIYVPESGAHHAEGFVKAIREKGSRAELRRGFVKRGQRTFIEPEQASREAAVRRKLTPIEAIFKGKRAAIYDDSLVRGTTAPAYVKLARAAGALEVHVRTSIVPAFPCFYGIDFASRNQLMLGRLGKDGSQHEELERKIAKQIGADSFRYLPPSEVGAVIKEAYKRSRPEAEPDIACLNGSYPTPDGQELLKLSDGSKRAYESLRA